MSSIRNFRTSLSAFALVAVAMPASGFAQDVAQQEDEESLGDVIVTGTRIRQGGAQDIQHFRATALSATTLPRPESLTVEGLLGEHDLTLPAGTAACDQLFCLNVQAMTANLPTRPDDMLFVGMAFDSNIDAASWQREPVSIMAVVDRSGSMTGPPITNVKAALHQMVDELGPQDRLGIVIYGTTSLIHLPATSVDGNKAVMHQAIDAIQIDGSTSMEAGLTLGYEAASAEAAKVGKVRMMLFTDEQPNVGRTDAGSFMAMAEAGSQRGIGLTTIGVGVQYDGALATKISSVRGGNLFFVAGPDKGRDLMQKEFRNMVSEVAHDLVMTLTPHAGYRISGVFGVPDGLMTEGKDGAIAITVPTAFLSSNGGGIYASLGKGEGRAHLPAATLGDGAPLMDVSLSYVSALDGSKHADRLSLGAPTAQPAVNLRLAQTLVDQYLAMDAATSAFHREGNPKKAFALLDGLNSRMAGIDYADLTAERELVDTMRGKAALYAGYGGEVPKDLQPMRVLGKWRVVALNGVDDLSRDDVVEFTDDEEFITYFKKPLRGDDEMYQQFQINEKEIYIPEGDLRVRYRINGDRLRMTSPDGQVRITLQRETKS